ncbi:hypothetical protein [Vibrio spartinae]|uniref:Uncharacterized protein n=1 Tax=Vibrio spartinae TaxID=1918945 RepID=A0A1N6M9K4_9VIBR|nr:hypothetical protein [Vibrio spartinae]SIO96081.1 hypothetical protein VSP9026_03839 [Vibrio spartinae]
MNHKHSSELLVNQKYRLSEDINLPDGTVVDMTIQLQDEAQKDLAIVKEALTISDKSVDFPIKIDDLAKQSGADVSRITRLIATHDVDHARVFEAQNKIVLPVIADIDDTYITFADERMTIEGFADQVYLSHDPVIIDHIMTANPHLKRSFSQIVEGMPMVVSPYSYTHPDESYAIQQADELMNEFLQLSEEQQQWFAQHHETATNALLVSAASQLDVYEGSEGSNELSVLNLSNILAGTGSVIAGAQVQGDRISKTMKSFAEYSRSISEQTKGLSGQALYSHPAYKEWRRETRRFQQEMKGILSEIGKPGYIKSVQAKRINSYLNVGKKQLYRAKDFSKAVAGVEMTALYKQAISFSKMLSGASWAVALTGTAGNVHDIYKTCNVSGIISEACGRSTVKNFTSGAINVGMGYGIGVGLGVALAPVSGGVSILLIGAGTLLWGMYGGDISNRAGNLIEEFLFD